MTDAERRAALEAIAAEVRDCTRCRLHETRTQAVPGEGDPSTEVVFVGEGPGLNEDREGRPFVGRAGGLLVNLLGHIGWTRDDVFITNVVKCRPPGNRDPEPDEIAACAPYLRRQLEVLDPAVVVTLGRHSMGAFMPGARITQAHGTTAPGRSGDRRRGRHGLRDVPPGRGPAHAVRRARELRGHGTHPGRAPRARANDGVARDPACGRAARPRWRASAATAGRHHPIGPASRSIHATGPDRPTHLLLNHQATGYP